VTFRRCIHSAAAACCRRWRWW